MIKETNVSINLNAKTIKHYWLIGYTGTTNDVINVKISDLTKGSHVKITAICDRCGKEKKISYKDYLINCKKYNLYTCPKCSDEKKILTNIKKFGTDRAIKNKEIKEQVENTNIKKYGSKYYILTTEFINDKNINDKRKQTRIKNGSDISDDNLSEWSKYKKIVRNSTEKKKKILISQWNGYDYYDNEYIKDNLIKNKPRTPNYPTIDHKISIKYGFDNNIEPNILCELDNLCITKLKNNCSKRSSDNKTFEKSLLR